MRSFSRQLGINSSYLSKILKGERAVSVRLIEQAAKKLQIPQPVLDRLLEAQRVEKELETNKILVDIPRGKVFRLLGIVPEEKANLYLGHRGLTAVSAGGGAVAALGVQAYEDTNFGQYQEFYLSIFARDDRSATIGYTFDATLVSSPEVKTMYLEKLGVPQELGEMRTEVFGEAQALEGFGASVLGVEDGEDPKGTEYWKASTRSGGFVPSLERGTVVAFSMGDERLLAYRIDLQTAVVHKKPFSASQDSSWVNPKSRLGRLVGKLGGFQPVEWQYGDIHATLFKPFSKGG